MKLVTLKLNVKAENGKSRGTNKLRIGSSQNLGIARKWLEPPSWQCQHFGNCCYGITPSAAGFRPLVQICSMEYFCLSSLLLLNIWVVSWWCGGSAGNSPGEGTGLCHCIAPQQICAKLRTVEAEGGLEHQTYSTDHCKLQTLSSKQLPNSLKPYTHKHIWACADKNQTN